jgi:NhaP-type Na+/H+ or K+/H+ antiporter
VQQWFLLVGALLVAMAFGSSVVRRLPLSPAMLYLAVGFAIGPGGARWIDVDIVGDAATSSSGRSRCAGHALFGGHATALPNHWRSWWLPLRLATLGMVLTTVLATVAAHWVLACRGRPHAAGRDTHTDRSGACVELQIRNPGDRDAVRLALTAEGGPTTVPHFRR